MLIAVHLFGLPCNIHKIKKICSKYKIKVIEDAAEAMGSFYKNKHLGNFSEAGVISFNGNKTITCGGGAVIISSNKKLIDTIRHLSTTAKVKHPWEYIHNDIGFNYRMTNLNAAVGCAQIENITKIISSKRKNLTAYKNIFKKIKDVKIFDEPINSKSNFWLITAMFQKKIKYKVLKELNKHAYLNKDMHEAHDALICIGNKCQKDNLNTSLKIYNSSINLPSSPKINLIK